MFQLIVDIGQEVLAFNPEPARWIDALLEAQNPQVVIMPEDLRIGDRLRSAAVDGSEIGAGEELSRRIVHLKVRVTHPAWMAQKVDKLRRWECLQYGFHVAQASVVAGALLHHRARGDFGAEFTMHLGCRPIAAGKHPVAGHDHSFDGLFPRVELGHDTVQSHMQSREAIEMAHRSSAKQVKFRCAK